MTRALQLRAALTGSVEDEIRRGRRNVERALGAAVNEYGEDLQSRWRADVAGSRLAKGPTLAKAIRLAKYPNNGLDPAVLVYVNKSAVKIIAAFESGGTVRSKQGKFLLVPNPRVWPGGRVRRARSSSGGGSGGQSSELIAAISRFGPLTFVPARPGRPAMLIATASYNSRSGRFRMQSRTARQSQREGRGFANGATTIVVFWLVKETRQEKLLRGAQIRHRARTAAPRAIDRLFIRNMSTDTGSGR